MMPANALADLLLAATQVVQRADDLALSMLADGVKGWRKSDRSPVTEIDLAVDALLRRELRALLPGAGWLSEETADDLSRRGRPLVWIVDPIDGTRSLLNNTGEFAISVALAAKEVGPVLGIVSNPSTGEVFVAQRDRGARELGRGPLSCADSEEADPLRLLVSRTELAEGLWRHLDEHALHPTSSLAYKMALVARGDADATLTPWPRSEWDAAAGHLLVTEAGGKVADAHGAAIRYNAEDPRLSGIIAASSARWNEVTALAPELRRRRKIALSRGV